MFDQKYQRGSDDKKRLRSKRCQESYNEKYFKEMVKR